jgi:hypothetical protein
MASFDDHAEPTTEYRGRLTLIDVHVQKGRGGVRNGAKVVARFGSGEGKEGTVEIVLVESVQRLRETGPTQQEGLEEHLHDVLRGLDILVADRMGAVRRTLSVLRGVGVQLV